MAYLSKAQYSCREKSAEKRNLKNEQIAVKNGMTKEQAIVVSSICRWRHKFHHSMDRMVKVSDSPIPQQWVRLEEDMNKVGLPPINVADKLNDIDTIDGLIYYYGDDVPEDYDSEEFHDWYNENYARIYEELENVHKHIEKYLADIDKKYNTYYAQQNY